MQCFMCYFLGKLVRMTECGEEAGLEGSGSICLFSRTSGLLSFAFSAPDGWRGRSVQCLEDE